MALQPWRTGKVIRIENETYNTRRYWIEVPELESFDFLIDRNPEPAERHFV